MPFTGGFSPGPERYGGGDGNGSAPLLQRVFESIAAQRGDAYDQTVNTAVGVENMALARALTFDGYGANTRLANQFLPSKMTADGLLPRWEVILNVPPLPGDTEPVRRARVAAALARIGQPNTHQPIVDALTSALGELFSGTIQYDTPDNAVSIWPGWTSGPGGPPTDTVPWYSTIDRIQVELLVPPAYQTPTGGPNAAWWAALNVGAAVLDVMLPAWVVWQFFVESSHGDDCFYLDEASGNLDLEIFCA